ncbi:exonuclease 3'-5' domain-containing protein 2-like [Chelonus insularis]|uniref:exonuclease 3'-5' domain-containing protein 2-like n=1 Tax=Chelonus insularis TaxID=460826 RepID=UPI00158C9114|nr:exonuclease 3'-5' domain-containing protein 2-like [Chelonus insularis]
MFFICLTVGLVFLASKLRENVIHSVKNLCHNVISHKSNISDDNNNNYQIINKQALISLDKIILADSPEKCDYAIQQIYCDSTDNVLGFDCEWVNESSVSLLQLATNNGLCALFRLGKIGYVPLKLKELLANKCIIKVGVGSFEDGKRLTSDYGCTVVGTIDLRLLANHLEISSHQNLSALCLQYLGIELNKTYEVTCSDWNAISLTDEQIEYAASDAIASVLIFYQMKKVADKKRSTWKKIVIFIKKTWAKGTYCDLPEGILDTRYRSSSQSSNGKLQSNSNQCSEMKKQNVELSEKLNIFKKPSIPTRKEPLYHNCYLQAPDGETLCTCDRKKAEWYINKNLGTKVNDDPLTVKLNFEPSGRAFGEVGRYYTQVKVNQCVVCGASDKFIKKNVIPREYRKYFPLVMKAHQSHDVLLLCPTCHEKSNKNDLDMRRKLAVMCDAPLSKAILQTRNDQYRKKKELISAVKALKFSSSIPPQRKRELEIRIAEYTSQSKAPYDLAELVQKRINNEPVTSTSHRQMRPPHGLKVVQYFTNSEGGLVTLERMWREHFLTTMQPQYLPKLWSVRHNQERLMIRQTQNRIEPEDAKVAGLSR